MVRTEARRNFAFKLGSLQIFLAEVVGNRVVQDIRHDGIRATGVDDGLDAVVPGLRLGGIGLSRDQRAIELRQLLIAQQQGAAGTANLKKTVF
ncbi:hypothetical protein D3C87_1922750 [compost metagenome]